ncbi:Catenin alpha-1 [Saguinus oedipus]|uniref:Catenin alpha-1 n=1 Tax=Saguinus oedipus TaxID=9490 RepID=A0ABQ9UM48_SAGOE|nr:Catenin alpha-1 [Saguinus oedipus]
MCMIMMEMTDFTRGKGPLRNTSDVISAAKKIAETGSRMEKFGHTIADHCPNLACKQDLLAYVQRIALYCHQLNICCKVEAEKMKAPEKKPLVKREKQDETQTKIKQASQKKHMNLVQALSEFKAMDSI